MAAYSLAIRKLFKVVKGDCAPDNADAPATQEIQLPGHVMQLVLKVFSLANDCEGLGADPHQMSSLQWR